jgi:hypothetical protein
MKHLTNKPDELDWLIQIINSNIFELVNSSN